jgi:hypothetical protein
MINAHHNHSLYQALTHLQKIYSFYRLALLSKNGRDLGT